MSSVASDIGAYISEHQDALIQRPVRILIIIVVGLLVRFVLHRIIDRLTKLPDSGSMPAMFRVLSGNAAGSAILQAASFNSERVRQRAATVRSVLKSAVSFTILVICGIYIVSELGFSLAPLLATTSIAGVAIGFGAQNLIKDFLAGIFMIMEDQYGVGDVVDLKEATGTIEGVGLRTTRLRDERGTVWYVRNGEIIRVGNQSQGYAQVVLDVPVAPSGDVARAEEAMREVGAQLATEPQWAEKFLSDPVVLGIQSITLEGTTIRMVARVKPLEQWTVARELRGRIRTRLDAVGVPAQTPSAPADSNPNADPGQGPPPGRQTGGAS